MLSTAISVEFYVDDAIICGNDNLKTALFLLVLLASAGYTEGSKT